MNKKGQVYIIGALILSVALFMLISQTNFVQRILFEDDFEQISKNFDVESGKFMNTLLAGDSDLTEVELMGEFTSFTHAFTEYAKVENPEFEFVYVLDYKDIPLVGYYLQTEDVEFRPEIRATLVTMDASMQVGDTGVSIAIPRESTVVNGTINSIKIRDIEYSLILQPNIPQLIIISREEKGNQTKVYLNEEFVTGEKVI